VDNRILASGRIKQEVQGVLRGQETGGHPLDRLVHLGAQYLLRRVLEEEVQEFLGRGYYRHGEARRGWRNGYEPKGVKTPVGVLTMPEGAGASGALPEWGEPPGRGASDGV